MRYTWVERHQGVIQIHLIVEDSEIESVTALCETHGASHRFWTVTNQGVETDLKSGVITLYDRRQEMLFRLMGDADTEWPS